ncbi:MAG: thioredoxin domain-containing protein [Acidiferrobacterales bacterium]|nr:thioredoxin domain-containing protein [Acidiferrobacterales bacterium]
MPNRLATESSPYLLQHADHPVDWYPWGPEALTLSRQTGKPLLVSIGYAACHWCHVMSHECFENIAIADTMNRNFVCVKVDREERPDLDRIYQISHQMLNDRPGGWPLTLALTPDGNAPFFAGTYFPPTPRHGLPGFGEILESVTTHYEKNQNDMDSHVESFRKALDQLNPSAGGDTPDPITSLDKSMEALKERFDAVNGGFGDAPKFPHPTQLELLLRHAAANREQSKISMAMVNKTLRKMSLGGLYDQIGGGFFRYSTDKQWTIPHFEKMLYDNSQLLGLYTDGYCLTQNPIYRETAIRTAEWAMTTMQMPNGGYASTLDADSEGVEGKFYVWSETDLRAILSEPEYEKVEQHFGLFGEPNFDGKWHFNVNQEGDHIPVDESKTPTDEVLETALDKLDQRRGDRIHPNLDDKILTAWNGLMIKGMARAGRRLSLSDAIQSAEKALDYIRTVHWQDGRLFVTSREQQPQLNGYLDDYAFLAEGVLELLQAKWRSADATFLVSLCDAMLDWFEDQDLGAFFFTSHDHETLLHRPKPGADDAIPSSNGVAANVLFRTGILLSEPRYIEASLRTMQLYGGGIAKSPSVFASLTSALQDTAVNARAVVIRGREEDASEWLNQLNSIYLPHHSIYFVSNNAAGLPEGLEQKKAIPGKVVAYLCEAFSCSAAIEDFNTLKQQLTQK